MGLPEQKTFWVNEEKNRSRLIAYMNPDMYYIEDLENLRDKLRLNRYEVDLTLSIDSPDRLRIELNPLQDYELTKHYLLKSLAGLHIVQRAYSNVSSVSSELKKIDKDIKIIVPRDSIPSLDYVYLRKPEDAIYYNLKNRINNMQDQKGLYKEIKYSNCDLTEGNYHIHLAVNPVCYERRVVECVDNIVTDLAKEIDSLPKY